MSREAQAAREKQARIILGQAEMEIAHSFEVAAQSYHNNPTALHLRAMNMLYEGLKEKGALMLIPSSAVESMGMGGLMGAAALQQQRLTETGVDGIGGLGLVIVAGLVTYGVPALRWAGLITLIGGLAIGLTLLISRHHRVRRTAVVLLVLLAVALAGAVIVHTLA